MVALRVLVCVWIATLVVPTRVWAQPVMRRPVAIVNLDLSNNSDLIALAKQLNGVLETHDQLRPVGSTNATWDRVTDADQMPIADAQAALIRATELLRNGDYSNAIEAATNGQLRLHLVTPAQAVRMYADLAFVRGKALLGNSRIADAQAMFGLVQRLDPSRTLDEAREPFDVVEAYQKAKPSDRPTGRVEVKGEGIVWIDGVDRGRGPNQFVVPAGLHVVALTNETRETHAVEVDVKAGTESITQATIADVAAPQSLQVERARKEVALAPDATKKSVAMKRLAAIVGVKDVLILSMKDGKIFYQAWRSDDAERAPGFSAPHDKGKEMPAKMFEDLAPPPTDRDDEPQKYVIPPDITHWYERPSYWAGITFGAAIVGVGVYFLVTSLQPDSVLGPMDVGLPGPQVRR